MTDLIDLKELRLEREVWVPARPADVYDVVSAISAMTSWSPYLVGARYDDVEGVPRVGAWFTGRNRDEHHEWETRARITEADPGRAIAWTVVSEGADVTLWRYAFDNQKGGTLIKEFWVVHQLTPFLGTTREELLALRTQTAASMEATLAALAREFPVHTDTELSPISE